MLAISQRAAYNLCNSTTEFRVLRAGGSIGSSYGVRYTYQDEQGKNCNKWESFSTKEEATNRKKQIEHELANGTFLIPSTEKVHRSSFPPE